MVVAYRLTQPGRTAAGFSSFTRPVPPENKSAAPTAAKPLAPTTPTKKKRQ